MSRALVISSALVCAVLAACAGDDPPVPGPKTQSPGPLGDADVDAILHTLSPMPDLPADPTNAYADDPRAAALGQRLFHLPMPGLGIDPITPRVSCSTCHFGPALDDRRSPNAVSKGITWGSRNALPIVNSAYYVWSGWGGRFDSQWSLVLGAAENPKVVGTTRLAIAHLLFSSYRDEYDAIFPVPLDPDLAGTTRFPSTGAPGSVEWNGMTAADQNIVTRIFVNYGKAIAAYMRRLVTKNAPFDRWVAGDAQAISDSAARGVRIFVQAGCVQCHKGPRFTDDDFHWDATKQVGAHVPVNDNGRADDLPALLASPFTAGDAYSDAPQTSRISSLVGKKVPRSTFRTKSLRDIGTSAPYMHCGQFATLEAVVDHYCGVDALAEPAPQQSTTVDTGGYGGGTTTTPPPNLPDPAPAHFVALTPAERTDLVAFLKTLDGEPLDPNLLKAEGP